LTLPDVADDIKRQIPFPVFIDGNCLLVKVEQREQVFPVYNSIKRHLMVTKPNITFTLTVLSDNFKIISGKFKDRD